MSEQNAEQITFSVHPYLQRRWKSVGRKLAFSAKDRASWKAWRRKTQKKLRQLTGYDTMQKAPLKPRITDQIEFDGYLRQRVEIQSEPGLVVPMYVLIPRKVKPPYNAIIAPHGHSSGGKIGVSGCRENPSVSDTIDKHNYDYGLQFVKAGFITFCPDARGFGERREQLAKNNILDESCQWINNMAIPLGQTVTGMWTWDIHRIVDYVQIRPDCRPDRIGCAGLSGGGLQTLWASALDERIQCAIVSGYLYGYKESLLDLHGNCSCNYVPHLYEHVDMGDIGALIAPRPLLVETGTRDTLNGASGMKNVLSQMRIIKRAYSLLGAKKNLKHDIFEGEHRWHGTETIPWMKRFLG